MEMTGDKVISTIGALGVIAFLGGTIYVFAREIRQTVKVKKIIEEARPEVTPAVPPKREYVIPKTREDVERERAAAIEEERAALFEVPFEYRGATGALQAEIERAEVYGTYGVQPPQIEPPEFRDPEFAARRFRRDGAVPT